MTLLEFARGPAMWGAITLFIAGVTFRLAALLFMKRVKAPQTRRAGAPSPLAGGLQLVWSRSFVGFRPPFRSQTMTATLVAWTFHLGLAGIVFGGSPHILFFGDALGLHYPGLAKGIIDTLSGITLAALMLALWLRLTQPVRRRLSDTNDYLSWGITTLPVVTGILATSGLGGRYESVLATHILSFELMLIWFPFGKLMHAFLWAPSRWLTGARYAQRGARL